MAHSSVHFRQVHISELLCQNKFLNIRNAEGFKTSLKNELNWNHNSLFFWRLIHIVLELKNWPSTLRQLWMQFASSFR